MRLSVSVIDAGSMRRPPSVIVVPVGAGDGDDVGLLATPWTLPDPVITEVAHLLRGLRRPGQTDGTHPAAVAGRVNHLPRPTRDPAHVLLVGVGDRGAQAWREVGAAVYRAAADRFPGVAVMLPTAEDGGIAGEFALGAWLAAYRFEPHGRAPRTGTSADAGRRALRRISVVTHPEAVEEAAAAVARARVLAGAVMFTRDLTNTPSGRKSPKWFADRIAAEAARRPGVTVRALNRSELVEAGFGGLLAVGAGSPRPPAFVELGWRPRGARTHVVLAGKGICFDTGGISLKPLDGMRLMRKDMAGAAAVCATVLAAADLALPIRVTALAPLAENLVSGSSMRPGDVIRHYGGLTSEVLDTDAEGRLVVGDALAYAAKRLRPDWLVDLATLTGASHVALGKRTAALFSDSAELTESLRAAGDEAGEPVWPLPLSDDYLGLLRSDVADLANIGRPPQAGSVVAALYLRELTGDYRDRWAHIDMSAPSWVDRDDGPLVKGATGWGVRLLVRFLTTLAEATTSGRRAKA